MFYLYKNRFQLWHAIKRASLGFPGGSEGKVSACNAGDLGSIPGSGRSPGEGNGNPLQYSYLENPMDGQPGGYSPWGHKEFYTTKRLTHTDTHIHVSLKMLGLRPLY